MRLCLLPCCRKVKSVLSNTIYKIHFCRFLFEDFRVKIERNRFLDTSYSAPPNTSDLQMVLVEIMSSSQTYWTGNDRSRTEQISLDLIPGLSALNFLSVHPSACLSVHPLYAIYFHTKLSLHI